MTELYQGDQIGALWGHIIGGAQSAGDPDNPIASSHHGTFAIFCIQRQID